MLDLSSVPALAVFVVVYGIIMVRNVRGIRIPIWAAMSIGAIAVLLLQVIPLEQAYLAINFEVLMFLFGMFVLVSGMESSGLLKYVTIKILECAKTPRRVLLFILLVLGLLSAFLINDTVALVATPIVIGLAAQMGMRPTPLLVSLAFGITIGSVLTPIGNPQNLLVALDSGMASPFWNFVMYLIAPTLACMAATYLVLARFYKTQLSAAVMPPATATIDMVTDLPLAKTSSLITVFVIVGFFAVGFVNTIDGLSEINFSHVAFAGGLALLAASKHRKKIFMEINWKIIAFFTAMFVFMAAMWDSGIIEIFASFFPSAGPSGGIQSLLNILVTSTGLSQVMSNVPFVAVYLPVMHSLGYAGHDTLFWIALASASTLAGNLTILGAASNIIILEAAEKKKEHAFSFWEFFKVGAVVTALNLAILFAFLAAYFTVGV